MKDDKEFLKAIYAKAEILERKRARKDKIYKNAIRFSSLAAIFIILPLLIFNNQILGPRTIEKSPEPRIMMINEPTANFTEADYILIGEIVDLDADEAIIKIDKVIYGDIDIEQIPVLAQADLIIGIRSIFFLNRDENGSFYLTFGLDSQFKEIERDVFIDINGNTYDLKEIENNIDRRK